jgi:hypothetical protein
MDVSTRTRGGEGTHRGCVYSVGVASDDEVDCSSHFGAKPPTYDARLACGLLGRVEKEADVAPAALCECGDAGIGDVSSRFMGDGVEYGDCACTDMSGGKEGIDGDKVDGLVEDGVGEGADGELGTDNGGQLPEAETCGGVGGVEEAGAVEKVRVGVARGGVADVDGASSGQST